MHTEHNPARPHKCSACGCGGFISDFACLTCDKKFEDHVTLYETEPERKAESKPIRTAFMPLASNPEV